MKDIEPGSLVFVPIRKRRIPAILISTRSIKDAKTEIKRSDFELKKIDKAGDEKFFSKEFMETAEEMADYFGTNLGQVISCYVPNNLFKGYEKNIQKVKIKAKDTAVKEIAEEKKHIVELVQAPIEDRIAFYKSLIRENFARKSSVFLCLPTTHEVNVFADNLKKGIEDYTLLLRPEDSPKKLVNARQTARDKSHPLLIIATPIFSCFLDDSFETVIIEKESSNAHKTLSRPFIDSRLFIEKLAKKLSLRLILGDTVLRLETLHKKEIDEYSPSLLFKYRLISRVIPKILDTKKDKNNFDTKAISEDLLDVVRNSIEAKKNTLLLTTKKGLSSATICGDCKTIVSCKNCGSTTTLHRRDSSNVFFCHKCGTGQNTNVLCNKCRSWNLRPVGFGTERVEDELRDNFPDANILRMDGESVKTHRQSKEMMTSFEENKGSVMIGTEMALFYLTKPIENIAIVSTDSLFFVPDFKINERVFNFLVSAKLMAENNFIIQTRCADNPIFEKIVRGDALQFYKEEILLRKNFNYPPFRLFIKITGEGKEEVVTKEFDELAIFLKKWNPEKFRSSSNLPGGKARMNLLIKVNPVNWPEKSSGSEDPEKMSLPEILKILPPRFAVKVDAESIL
ncbi:MAG: Primosomal protein N' [Parcubacteria group bacterium GW2011_GWF2_38_76]|nr:MAG: Primosomal protein N' [Parcubacteria group bacterium GW2011_GWF2_38_76]